MNDNQLTPFALAEFFYPRIVSAGIVVVIKDPKLLVGQLPTDIKLFVVCRSSGLSKDKKLLEYFTQLNFINVKDLKEDFLATKILVNLSNRWTLRLAADADLQKAQKLAAISINSGRFAGKLATDRADLYGKTKLRVNSRGHNRTISLGGRLVDIKRSKYPTLSVLAVIHMYNESDIIEATIQHLLEQDVDVYVIDNWSDDGSYEIVQRLSKQTGRVFYERFPKRNNRKFELAKLLTRVTKVASEHQQYKWIMLNDADEIRWSPWPDISLKEGFSFIDSLGYNAVDYTVFNFLPTTEGFDASKDPKTFFRYGEFGRLTGFFKQVKAWRNHPEATLAPSGGHQVSFSGLKIFPVKFLLCHYPLRSTGQAKKKIFKDRMPRYAAGEKIRGWHTHYKNLKETDNFISPSRGLVRFDDNFNANYLVERISGVGIVRDFDD